MYMLVYKLYREFRRSTAAVLGGTGDIFQDNGVDLKRSACMVWPWKQLIPPDLSLVQESPDGRDIVKA